MASNILQAAATNQPIPPVAGLLDIRPQLCSNEIKKWHDSLTFRFGYTTQFFKTD